MAAQPRHVCFTPGSGHQAAGLQCRALIRFLREQNAILQNINLVEISRQCVRHYLQLNGAGLLEAHGADVVESLPRNLPLSQSRG